MEIHTIFIPLLICTGIFGFTDAQDDFSRDLNYAVHKLFEIARLTDEYDNATINAYAEGQMNRFRKVCEKNGGAGALTIAAEKIHDTKQCIVSLKQSTNVEFSNMRKYRYEPAEVFIRTYCPHVSDLESCINKFGHDNPCLGPTELEIFDVVRDAIIGRLQFVCKNDGENFKKLMDTGVLTCLRKRKTEVTRCRNETIGDTLRKHISKVISTSESEELPFSLPDKKKCALLEKYLECRLNVVQRCNRPEGTRVIKDMLDESLVALRCRNSANSQSTPISLII